MAKNTTLMIKTKSFTNYKNQFSKLLITSLLFKLIQILPSDRI